MAAGNARSPEEIRREIETERDELATAVDTLRAEIGDATNVGAKLKARLPAVATMGARRAASQLYRAVTGEPPPIKK